MNKLTDINENTAVITNDNGGKESKIKYAYHMIPHLSIAALARVLAEGADRYDETYENRNFTKIPIESHINHAISHLIAYLQDRNPEDLAHAMARAVFSYHLAVSNKPEEEISRVI